MVVCRNGKESKPSATSYGRLHDVARKHSNTKKNHSKQSSTKKVTRASVGEVSTPPELKRAREEEEDETKSGASTLPPKKLSRHTYGGPRCFHYGPNRHILYKGEGFLFCHPCDNVDNELVRDKTNLDSLSFRCTAKHTSFIYPNVKKKESRYNGPLHAASRESSRPQEESRRTDERANSEKSVGRKIYFESSSESSDSSEDGETVRTPVEPTPTRRLDFANESTSTSKSKNFPVGISESEDVVSSLEQKIEKLKSKLETEKTYSSSLETLLDFDNESSEPAARITGIHTTTNVDMKNELTSSIAAVVDKHRRMGPDRVGKIIAEAAWDAAEGAGQRELIKKSSKWIRDNVYTAWGVLRKMDINGGTLGLQGLEVARSVETNDRKYYRGSLLPCKADILRCQKIVEEFGDEFVPYRILTMEDGGEGIEFDNEKAIRKIIEAYGLSEAAKTRPIRMAMATDGFQMTKRTTVMMGGAKMQDGEGCCPITKLPIFSDDPNEINAQSRKHCFPLNLYVCKETKKTIHNHDGMFYFATACGDILTTPYPDWMPIDFAVNTDMSGTWKLLDIGGAFKVSRYPCINCAILSEHSHEPNTTRCNRWCREMHMEREGWQCYHHEMLCPEKVEEMQEEVLKMSEKLTVALDRLDKKTRFPKNEDPDVARATSATNLKSVHYLPTNFTEKRAYSNFITDELLLRELETEGDLVIRKDRLVTALRSERQCRNLAQKIKHATPKENALFAMMQAIPCILHCSNRVNIKLLSVLLTDGLNNAKSKKILSEHAGLGKRIDNFLLGAETIVNQSILGTVRDPAQWSVPLKDDSTKSETNIGAISMDNGRTVNIIDKLELLIDYCIPESVDRKLNLQWKSCMPHYRSAMERIRQKTDFTDADIRQYQEQFDLFFQEWMAMYGLKGITNYIHLLSSGHMSDYLHKWRNLYLHSQQGWESLNNLVKIFFFRRTGRGGGKYGKSKLKPIARWLQRRLLWLCGHTYEEMLAFHEKKKAEKAAAEAAGASASSAASNAQEEKMDESEDDDDDDIWFPGLDLNNGDEIDNMYDAGTNL
jgi:hypothetical protein